MLERAERTPCEGRDYEGLSLGELFRAWPEEILSGRAVRGRANTDAKRMMKAYAKAMQAVSELSQLTHGVPLGRNVPLPRDDARARPELPNNFRNLPLADAMVPFDAALVPPRLAAEPPLQDGGPDEQHRNPIPGDRSLGRTKAWNWPAHVLRPHLPAAFEQQVMEWLRSQGLARLPGEDPPTGLHGRLRITVWGLVATLLTLFLPKLVGKLCSWMLERIILTCLGVVFRLFEAAGTAFESSGERIMAYVEENLDLDVSGTASGPRRATRRAGRLASQSPAAAAAAAASAVVEQLSGNASNVSSGMVAAAVQSAVAASVAPAEPPEWAVQMGDYNSRLPGWVLLVAGVFVQRMMPGAAPAPQFH